MHYYLIGKSKETNQVRLYGKFKSKDDATTAAGLWSLEPTDEKIDFSIKTRR